MIIVLYFLLYVLLLVLGYLMGRETGIIMSIVGIGVIHSFVLQLRHDMIYHTIHPRCDSHTIDL